MIWRPSITRNEDIDDTQDDDGPPDSNSQSSSLAMSQEVRNRLRGKNTRTAGNTAATRRRRAREYSPVSDDEENDENKTKRARKVPAGLKKTKTAKKK